MLANKGWGDKARAHRLVEERPASQALLDEGLA